MKTVSQELQTFNIDAKHSSVEFSVHHMVISSVRGRFGIVDGTATLATGSDVPTAVNVAIATSSISTNEDQRDSHIKSTDFLDVDKHPMISFQSTTVNGDPENFLIAGNLRIHGVTKTVRLTAFVSGRTLGPCGMERVAYTAGAIINRHEFGIVWNKALKAGGELVGSEVKIEISVQVVRPRDKVTQ